MIFLTGATGLLGSAVAKSLVSRGYKIKAHYRHKHNISALGNWTKATEWVSGDLLDPGYLNTILADCHTIIHCAGKVSFQPHEREEMYEANVLVTENLVNAALATSINRFVHISSVAALGRPRNKKSVSENQQWEESDLNSYYAKTKHWAEVEVWRGVAEGLSATILNPSVILAYHPQFRSSSGLINYALEEHKYYPGGHLNWVAAEDVVKAVLEVLENNQTVAERYIISAGSVPYKDFFTLLANHLAKRAPYVEAKFYTMMAAYYLKQISKLFGKKENLISKETIKLSRTNIEFDNSKSIRELRLNYMSLPEAIAQLPRP